MEGYIKLYRSINQNELLDNDNNALVVFIKILTKANRLTGTYTTGRHKLAVACNLKSTTLYGVLKRLESSSIIRLEADRNSTTIYICNWWKYQQDTDKSSSSARRSDDTIQEKKENIDTKVSNSKAPSAPKTKRTDIDEMFETWEQTVGYKVAGQQQKNRYACSNLLKKYGSDGLNQLLQGVKLAQQDKYAPSIADFVALQSKQNDLIAWGKKKQVTNFGKVVQI